MRLSLCYPIESRDGTLNADSKLKNMVVENVEGELIAVKRPGVTKASELAPGLAQGLFSLNGMAYGIVNDILMSFDSAETGGGITGGFDLRTGRSIAYSNGYQYARGDIALAPDENNNDTPWYCIVACQGIPPGYTQEAFPYWSKYKNHPVGTHPTVSTKTNVWNVFKTPTSARDQSVVNYYLDGVYYSTLSGFSTWDYDKYGDGYSVSRWTNYYFSGGIRNGMADNRGATAYTDVPLANSPFTYGVMDYARSILR